MVATVPVRSRWTWRASHAFDAAAAVSAVIASGSGADTCNALAPAITAPAPARIVAHRTVTSHDSPTGSVADPTVRGCGASALVAAGDMAA